MLSKVNFYTKGTRPKAATEDHRGHRIGWLRAAVLGANDGILSTASLIVGVASAQAARQEVLLAGVAGLVAGAMSMAAGEYVSVSSQADTQLADLAIERRHLAADTDFEHAELASIYVGRGLTPEVAAVVATQLMAHDALGAHARDELGFSEASTARPTQAAFASACSFAVGGLFPLAVACAAPIELVTYAVFLGSLAFLASLGGIAAQVGGASPWRGAFRVALCGVLAMGATAVIGALFSPRPP